LRDRLAVFKPIRENAKGKSLNAVGCLLPCLSICQDARKFWHFCDPATVFLLLYFNG
jgi:hypothetical protein